MYFRFARFVFLFLILTGAQSAFAQKENTIIARANGVAITTSDVELFRAEHSEFLANIPQELHYKIIVNNLVQQAILAKGALDLKIHQTKDFQYRLAYYQKRALGESYRVQKVNAKVTDKRVKAYYDSLVANAKPADEVKARHIIVKTRSEAEAIIEELKKGADFVALAKEKSSGPSREFGGDMGYFTKLQNGKIGEVAFRMKKGEISEPIQTKLGWHIVKLEDRRKRKLQEFRDIKDRLRDIIVRNEMTSAVKKLRQSAKIEYLDPKAAPDQDKNKTDKSETKPK